MHVGPFIGEGKNDVEDARMLIICGAKLVACASACKLAFMHVDHPFTCNRIPALIVCRMI
jgi:hypothetical protein